ncbi:MAG: SGNH/GDSL hydrolase family protein [Planctomycetes bacterium]|nr:SGNH/GDSL hydrolase family protein [Planctomycetota bacterium]
MRRFIAKLSISLAAILIFLTITNLLLDFTQAAPPVSPPMQIWGTGEDQNFGVPGASFRFHPVWFWEPNPGGIYNDEFINEDGYRGKIFTKEKSANIRIAALGDSSTMGYGVREADAWPRLLESELRTRGVGAEVINFGCVGYTVHQGFELYKGRVAAYHPDIVCIAFGAINEHFQPAGGTDDFTKAGILKSSKYGIYSFFSRFRMFRWMERAAGARDSLRAATVSSGGDRDGRPNMRVSPSEMEAILEHWTETARGEGRKVIFIHPPRTIDYEKKSPVILQFSSAVRSAADLLKVPVADVNAQFHAHEQSGGRDWLLDSVHPTPEGHLAYARCVLEAIASAGWLK